MNRGRWVASIATGALLSVAQSVLTPYLTHHGRGIPRALLSGEEAALLGPVVLLLVIAGSVDASTLSRSGTFWHCCIRGGLWAAILSLFFFEVICCCALRFQEVPPSGDLHLSVVFLYFGLAWISLLGFFLFKARLRLRLASRIS